MNPFDEVEDLRVSYAEVHEGVAKLYLEMKRVDSRPPVLIAIGRGGWVPARLLAAAYEEKTEVVALSISLSYIDIGTPQEKAIVRQGLDAVAIKTLLNSVSLGSQIWLVDSLYSMGGTISSAKTYVSDVLTKNGIIDEPLKVATLHWVLFDVSPRAPWRKASSVPPDAFGQRIQREHKVYVHYPWESLEMA